MSDSLEKGFTGQANVERVGDTLHRERLTRNVQVETIARDLKLNADYIRGIEESNYGKLPAVAYVRVYIKSIGKYLGLDSEALLEKFSSEMNLVTLDPERERRDTISVKVQGTKKANPILPILYVTVALVLVALLLKNGKRDSGEASDLGVSADSTKIEIPVDTGELGDDSLPKGVSAVVTNPADSAKVPVPVGESGSSNDSSSTKKTTADSSVIANDKKAVEDSKKKDASVKKKLTFDIQGKKDSSYVKIYADGKKVFEGVVRNSKRLSFAAYDSLNVMISKNSSVRYSLNGTVLNIQGKGSKIVKLNGENIELWRMNKWNETFEGR